VHQFLTRVHELAAALREAPALPGFATESGDGLLRLHLPASDEPAPMLLRRAQA